MRRFVSSFAIVAMLVQGPVAATAQQDAPRPSQRWTSGQCGRLAPLPQLGPESQRQDQGQWRGKGPGRPVPVTAAIKSDRVDAPVMEAPAPPPPPPPPTVAPAVAESRDAAAGESSGEIVTTASRAEASGDARTMPYPEPPRRFKPQPRPQAGLLTAGEHDDLLNPELYANYVRQSDLGQQMGELPVLDTNRVLTVSVRDGAGRPVPFARVEVACADGSRMALSTLADGTAAFFPQVDRLGSRVRVRALGEDWRDVAIAPGQGGQRIDFTVRGAAQAAQKLDLMLVIDTTGSMGDEIRYLQTELAAILDALRANHPGLDLRIGFVFYRDLGDDYVTATTPLTRDFNAAQAELRQRWAGGGGDYPEAMEQALIRAAGQQWRPDAVHSLLLVADAPPHDENMGTAWLAARHLRAQRVQIVPVAASGVADKAEYAMRAMAALTQSRYTFLTDDSGVGNPHAAPAIDCYLVTRLDALLRRVIDSQLSGRRIEPKDAEVIREVGQYENGRCIIPRGGLPQQ
ncbi:MAG: vWA domain-containing protein [Novosphingobium sp.]